MQTRLTINTRFTVRLSRLGAAYELKLRDKLRESFSLQPVFSVAAEQLTLSLYDLIMMFGDYNFSLGSPFEEVVLEDA
jgi:hypothetical protein